MIGARRRYALHMKEGQPTLEGLLVKNGRRDFELIAAQIVQDAETSHDLPGVVKVPRENVYCLQRID